MPSSVNFFRLSGVSWACRLTMSQLALARLKFFDFGTLSLVALKRISLPGAAGFEARRRELRHLAVGFEGGPGPYSVRWA
jgi:hypothetical protein